VTPDELQATPTWGERMAREARRLAARKLPPFRWARALEPLLRRATERPLPSADRFRRSESLPLAPAAPAGEAGPQPAAPEEGLPAPEGEPLPVRVRDRLRDLVGLRDERMVLHRGPLAEQAARAHRAEALTVGEHVLFGAGRLRPDEPRGLALLAHEATHVVQAMRPGASWWRATAAGLAEEEREARRHERAALVPAAGAATRPARVAPSAAGLPAVPAAARAAPPALPPAAAASPAARPLAAAIDRPAAEVSAQPGPDIEELRRTLLRDVLSQIRTEHERGG